MTVEHYVLSSGLKEIIEGSGIAHWFKKIYACEFYYRDGAACWPKLDVNFTNKTQFVYRINKGVLDVADDKTLNDSMPDDSKRVPFTNMIYVGDGLSDVPCMKMMRSYGGQAIAVYQSSNRAGVEDLLAKGRVDFIFPADYREGTGLDVTVQNIIRKMAISDALTAENVRQIQSIGHTEVPGQLFFVGVHETGNAALSALLQAEPDRYIRINALVIVDVIQVQFIAVRLVVGLAGVEAAVAENSVINEHGILVPLQRQAVFVFPVRREHLTLVVEFGRGAVQHKENVVHVNVVLRDGLVVIAEGFMGGIVGGRAGFAAGGQSQGQHQRQQQRDKLFHFLSPMYFLRGHICIIEETDRQNNSLPA